MSNPAPIGIFDSGVGGLSVMLEIRRLLPSEDLVYFADSAHCPYGKKTPEQIRARMFAITDFLLIRGSKMIVVACNTASIAGLDAMRARYAIPVVGMEPAVKPASIASRNGKIGVLATKTALAGERFNMLVERYGSGIEVLTQPCPGLVELVEAGKIDGNEVEMALAEYLAPLQERSVDTVVLGCTHYPFLRKTVERLTGPGVTVIDTGEAVARQVRRVLEQFDLAAPAGKTGAEEFFTSADADALTPVVRFLWGDKSAGVRWEPAESKGAE